MPIMAGIPGGRRLWILSYSFDPLMRDAVMTFHFARYSGVSFGASGPRPCEPSEVGEERVGGGSGSFGSARGSRRCAAALLERGGRRPRSGRVAGRSRARCCRSGVGGSRLSIVVRRVAENGSLRLGHPCDDSTGSPFFAGTRVDRHGLTGLENAAVPSRRGPGCSRRAVLRRPILAACRPRPSPRAFSHVCGFTQRHSLTVPSRVMI